MYVCGECGQPYEAGGFCGADGAALSPADDALLGTELGRYRVARVLGQGGMGRVYLGVQPAIGSRVAIKVLSDTCTRDPELLERFFAEARAVNLIRHEHIVNVLDLQQLPDGRPYIVMELVDGATLGALIRGRGASPISLGGVVQVMTEVLSALGAAHAAGVVHRDLKPDNVLVTAGGHAKVLDFGVAKLSPGLRGDLSPRTRTGAMLGTPAYMAPEQISGGAEVDARTDVYAAGVVLFEAVTGKGPFSGATVFDLMRAHLDDPPPAARQLRPELPASIERVIARALAKSPGARYQTADAMREALELAARELGVDARQPLSGRASGRIPRPTDTPPAFSAVTSRSPARRRWWIPVLGLAVAGGAAAAVLVATRDGETTPPTATATSTTPTPPTPATPTPPAQSSSTTPPPPTTAAVPVDAGAQPDAALVAGSPVDAAVTPPIDARSTPATIAKQVDVPATPAKPAKPDPLAGPAAEPATTAEPSRLRPDTTARGSYDPHRFDYRGFLPQATALAREVLPDAKLAEFELWPVFRDGHIDLTQAGPNDPRTIFAFFSPTAEHVCHVFVRVDAGAVHVSTQNENCFHRLIAPPRCSLATIWQRGLEFLDNKQHATMKIAFDANGWSVSGGGKGGTLDGALTVADDCP